MSSPPKKPYKSRLLNFLNRYFIKWNSEVNVKFRELGYALQGGFQTMMLPLLWVWKSTAKIGQLFPSSDVRASSLPAGEQLQNHRCDYLIEAVKDNLLGNPLFSSLLPDNYQGLASRLKDRHIVVIVKRNRIKKLIPKIKQDNLKFAINHVLDNQQKKQNNLPTRFLNLTEIFHVKKENNLDLKLENNSSSTIAKRNSNQLISWADNLFSRVESLVVPNQENSRLVVSPEEKSPQLSVNQENKRPLIVLIQQAIAHFFFGGNSNTQTLAESSQKELKNQPQIANQKTPVLLPVINHKVVKEIIPLVQNKTAQIVVKGIDKIQASSKNINQSLNNQSDPFQIKILILEAFNYFVNNQLNHKLFDRLTNTEVTILDEDNDQPWLSWEDLYGTQPSLSAAESDTTANYIIEEVTENIEVEKDSAIIIEEYTIPSNIAETPESITTDEEKNLDQDKIIPSMTYSEIIEAIEQEKSSVSTITKSTAVVPTESLDLPKKVEQNLVKQSQVKTVDKPEAETIETKVIEIKYEKHLLEIILEKLDLVIVWLEEKIIKLIQTLKILINNFSKKSN